MREVGYRVDGRQGRDGLAEQSSVAAICMGEFARIAHDLPSCRSSLERCSGLASGSPGGCIERTGKVASRWEDET